MLLRRVEKIPDVPPEVTEGLRMLERSALQARRSFAAFKISPGFGAIGPTKR